MRKLQTNNAVSQHCLTTHLWNQRAERISYNWDFAFYVLQILPGKKKSRWNTCTKFYWYLPFSKPFVSLAGELDESRG